MECEHAETLSSLPSAFRDTFDRAATRRFDSEHHLSKKRWNRTTGPREEGPVRIALYARDFRELGRWIPRDSHYVIGRCARRSLDE